MSSWRRSGPPGGQQQQQQQQNRPQQGNATARDRPNTPRAGDGSAPRVPTGQANTRGGRRENMTRPAPSAAPSSPQLEVETHVPVNGFNAGEVKEYLKKTYARAVADAGGDEKTLLLKIPADTSQPNSTAPWAARPNQMSNGQNFWVELVKQIKAGEEGPKGKENEEISRKGK